MYCTDRSGRPLTGGMDVTVVSLYVTRACHMKNKLSCNMLILCVFPPRGLQLCRKANARVRCHSECFQGFFLRHLLFGFLFFSIHMQLKRIQEPRLCAHSHQIDISQLNSRLTFVICVAKRSRWIMSVKKGNHVILLPVCSLNCISKICSCELWWLFLSNSFCKVAQIIHIHTAPSWLRPPPAPRLSQL